MGLILAVQAWIVRVILRNTAELVLSTLLLPPAFGQLSEYERRPPDGVHVHWGHFPMLVGFLGQRRLASVVTSLAIAPYELKGEYREGVVVFRVNVVGTYARANVEYIVRFSSMAAERTAQARADGEVRARCEGATTIALGDGPHRAESLALCEPLALGDSDEFLGYVVSASYPRPARVVVNDGFAGRIGVEKRITSEAPTAVGVPLQT